MKEFIGFENILDNFKKRATTNKLSHAHLIVGENGIGKSIIARRFALEILNKDVDKDYIDIITYSPKKATIGVDEVREIIDEVNKKPYEGDKKVIIVKEGHKLTVQAQNAFLKTIEEPPSGVYIIITVEGIELILDTIKSRCQIYKLSPLSRENIDIYSQKYNDIDPQIVEAAKAYSLGIPGNIDKFIMDDKLNRVRDLLIRLLYDLNKIGDRILVYYEKPFEDLKSEKDEILNILASFIRDIMIYKEVEEATIIINSDKINDIKAIGDLMSYKKLKGMLEYIHDARVNLKNNSNYWATISVMLMGFLEV